MEQLDYQHDRHTVRFVLVVGGLVMIAAGLIVMLFISLWTMPDITGGGLRLLVHVAWISLVLLLGVLILLICTVMRYVRHRLWAEKLPPATEHPDAWEEAGHRLKLDDASRNSSGHWRGDGPPPDEED